MILLSHDDIIYSFSCSFKVKTYQNNLATIEIKAHKEITPHNHIHFFQKDKADKDKHSPFQILDNGNEKVKVCVFMCVCIYYT